MGYKLYIIASSHGNKRLDVDDAKIIMSKNKQKHDFSEFYQILVMLSTIFSN